MRLTRHALPTAALLVMSVLAAPTTGTAHAVPKAQVPTAPDAAAVAEIYPELAGAKARTSSAGKITGVEDDCTEGSRIKGARGAVTEYIVDAQADPTADPTADPAVTVMVFGMGFTSVADASDFLDVMDRALRRCGAFADVSTKKPAYTPIRFRAGDERTGFTTKVRLGRQLTVYVHELIVRTGRSLSLVMVTSPLRKSPVAKAVELAELASGQGS